MPHIKFAKVNFFLHLKHIIFAKFSTFTVKEILILGKFSIWDCHLYILCWKSTYKCNKFDFQTKYFANLFANSMANTAPEISVHWRVRPVSALYICTYVLHADIANTPRCISGAKNIYRYTDIQKWKYNIRKWILLELVRTLFRNTDSTVNCCSGL